jgi:ubiquinone/menaquinone biosynthesis C-methylase UbiE
MTRQAGVHHPVFARMYTRMSAKAEARGQADHRRKLLAGLSERVIEVGAGNGLNFAYYPASVTEVVAVEPETYLRERAAEAAASAPIPVQVSDGLAEQLPFEDGSFDAGVASLLLCSVADQRRALTELFRVIRPGGELRFYEHVVSERPVFAGLERAADALIWSRLAGGCHLSRDTGNAIEQAGFLVETRERFAFTPFPFPPRIAHILGVARRA